MFNISPNIRSIDVTQFILKRWAMRVLRVVQIGVGFGDCVCAVYGRVLCGFGGSECVLYVGQFGVGLGE